MALTKPRAYQIYDIDYKQAVRAISLSNVTLAGGAPNLIDGVNLSLNDRILVAGQSSGAQNGIYYVTTVGSGSNGTWTRSIDTDTSGELLSGTIVMVTEGTTYADTQWKLITDDPIVIGSSELTFVQNYLANSISFGQTSFAIGSSNSNATISVAGTSNVAVFSTDGATFTGNLLPISNITYSLGSTSQRWKDLWISNSTIYLGNIVLGATDTQLTVGGNNVVTSTDSGNISVVGNISGSYILGNGSQLTGLPATYGNTDVANYLASGTNNSNIVTTGNIAGGNVSSSARLDVTGNIYTGNILTNGYYYANGVAFSGGSGGGGITWTTVANTAPSGANAGDFWYNSYTGIKYQYTNDGTNSFWVDQSAPTTFSSITTNQILNGGANGTGNIGTSATTFNTIFAKATSAQYADLAEKYASDADYSPGTVVVFGGKKEITISTFEADTRVAGVISTDPAFIMNSGTEGLHVALTGRVPCRVKGPVNKGDVLVTSDIPGTAQCLSANWKPGCVIGKSLDHVESGQVKIIEVVVGRF